ncbi:MAG: PKD domain-containing protein, partial [Bacteroidia bacterium]
MKIKGKLTDILRGGLAVLFLTCGQVYSQCSAVIGSNINPIVGCEILTVQFNDLSTGAVQSRTWDFGDGSPTTSSQNPVHSFSAGITGDTTYNVTLNIQCISGPSSVTTATVLVHKKPKVDLAANKVVACALSDSVCFSNLSTTGPGFTYLWNFGDFTTNNSYQPCHIYSTGGTYSVQLTVTNNFGCANSVTFNNYLTIIPAPTLDFNLGMFLGCTPVTETFTNITDTLSTSFSTWQWNFGDGSPIVNGYNPPSHIYTSAGTHFVTLSATNSLGCSNITTKAIVVRSSPTATFNFNSPICTGVTSILNYTGTSGAAANFAWSFSGGTASPGTGAGPQSVSWATPGTKTVTLTVQDSGCTATQSHSIVVAPSPTVTISVAPNDTICQRDSLAFTVAPASSSIYTFYHNGIVAQSSALTSYILTNPTSGDSVYATATSSNGCVSAPTPAIRIHVNPLPVVTLSANTLTVCTTDSITFTASPGGYDNYSFYQGYLLLQSSSGNSYTGLNLSNGDIISVVATDKGCSGDTSNRLTPVFSSPLMPPQVNCGNSTNSSIEFSWMAVSGATGYSVSVNGGPYTSPSSGANGITHTISGLSAGDSATIVVIALGPAPCGNSQPSVIQQCYAKNCSAITYSINPVQTICLGDTAILSLNSVNISNPNISWNGGAPGSANTFTVSPGSQDTVTVIVTDPNQPLCVPSHNYFVINVNPIPTVILSVQPANDTVCFGGSAVFTATPAGFFNYSFYTGATLLQSANNPVYNYGGSVSGNTTIHVVVTDNGCSFASAGSVVTVLSVPSVSLTSSSLTSCFNDTVIFTASPSTYLNYIFSYNGIPVQSSGSYVYSAFGLSLGSGNNISVTSTDAHGCVSNSSSITNFTVYPLPVISLSCSDANLSICNGELVSFTASPAGMANYQFYNSGNIIQSSANNLFSSSTIQAADTIKVRGIDVNGCKSVMSNSFTFTVLPSPNVFISANDTTICGGTSVVLTANQSPVYSGTTYSWSTGSSNSAINVSPAVTTN